MGASDEEDQIHVKQPRDPVRVDEQMRRTNIVISNYWGRAPDLRLGTRRGLCRAICTGLMKGAAQQGVPREEDA